MASGQAARRSFRPERTWVVRRSVEAITGYLTEKAVEEFDDFCLNVNDAVAISQSPSSRT